MKRHLLLTLWILSTLPILAQHPPGFQITSLSHSSGEHDYTLPLISSEEQPEVARKINLTLQLYLVQKSYEVAGEQIFDHLWQEEGYGMTSLRYTVLYNSPALLSIRFTDETLTSYPDYHTYYLTFNAATGDLIDLPELLTPQGLDRLNDRANSYFNREIKARMVAEPHEIKPETLTRVFQLTECNANHELIRYAYTGRGLEVEKDRCFPHALQNWDITWRHTVPKKLLVNPGNFTEYGRSLLFADQPTFTSLWLRKQNRMALHGKIDGKHEFTLLLTFLGNSVSGYYWYPRVGELLDFGGEWADDRTLVLTEEGGRFHLHFSENTVEGTWTNAKGQAFPIVFH